MPRRHDQTIDSYNWLLLLIAVAMLVCSFISVLEEPIPPTTRQIYSHVLNNDSHRTDMK